MTFTQSMQSTSSLMMPIGHILLEQLLIHQVFVSAITDVHLQEKMR